MTCIVGIEHDGKVSLGGDRAAVSNWTMELTASPKVFIVGAFAIGYTDSFRMGQLLQTRLEVGNQAGSDDEAFMATTFVDAVRKCLSDGGYAKKENESESGGNFLVGYRGRLYEVGRDYSVVRTGAGYGAVGVGFTTALGALHATANRLPVRRLHDALAAAEAHSCGVRGPFDVVEAP